MPNLRKLQGKENTKFDENSKTSFQANGQKHPWVVPLEMSDFEFPRPIEL